MISGSVALIGTAAHKKSGLDARFAEAAANQYMPSRSSRMLM